MRLARLDIQTLPGIDPGFSVEDIEPGTNLVTGPNAIGKSSLIRALRYLVGGTASGDPKTLALSATFVDADGNRWQVQRTGSQVEWRRDGAVAEAPPLPARDQLHCYWLSMEDLLDADDPDRALVEELRTALAGGYNLTALREESAFNVGPRIGQNEAKRVQAAERTVNEVEAGYAALRRDEAKLPQLEARIETARRARDRAEALDRALALLEARRERRAAEVAVAAYPEEMARLRGEELERLEGLETKRRDLSTRLETARARQADAARLLQECGLAERRPDEEALERERSRLEEVRHNRERLADYREQLEQARAEAEQARYALGGQGELPELTPGAVSEAETLARDLHARQVEAAEVAARIQQAPEAPGEQDLLCHGNAAEALTAWLAAAPERDRPFLPLILAALGALIATLGGAWPLVSAVLAGGFGEAAAMITGGTGAIWATLGGGVLALTGLVWAALAGRDTGAAAARQRFEDTGLAPPDEWSREAVNARLEALTSDRAGLHRARERAQEAAVHRDQLERVRERLAKLEAAREALAGRLGFHTDLTALGLDHFVRQVSAYQQVAARHRAKAEAVERVQAEIESGLEAAGGFLAQWGVEGDGTLEGLSAALSELAERCRRAAEADQAHRENGREAERLEQALTELANEERALYQPLGLEPGQRRPLEDLCQRLEEWREHQRALEAARIREQQRREALAGDAALLERVDNEEAEALARERDQASADAETLEALQREHTEIRTRLADAGGERRLEAALESRDAALDALQDRYEENLFAEAGRFLLERVEREHRSEHEPAVLREARERFQRFTYHDWDLELDDTQGFTARDLRRGERRPLAELSSGTRMQLLLAVRVAWTRRIEQGREPLPLFLDEALTTADEQRFDAVAGSLATLADDEDRQIFYLSARLHELALWERATGRRPHHIDLAAVRFGRPAQPADLQLPDREALPAPGNRSAAEYGAMLGVPPVDPRRDPGLLHLFHLLRDDLPLLHRLMEDWRINTLGQLEGLLGSNAATDAIGDTGTRETLVARCAAARSWFEAWRLGRGRPVDRIALEQSEAVTETYMDRVADLIDEVDGDAEALVQGLREGRVKGFRSNKTDELEQWLSEQGFIDPAEPLSADERERRTLLESGGSAPAGEIRQQVAWLEAGLDG